jgi:hypothetical protein
MEMVPRNLAEKCRHGDMKRRKPKLRHRLFQYPSLRLCVFVASEELSDHVSRAR